MYLFCEKKEFKYHLLNNDFIYTDKNIHNTINEVKEIKFFDYQECHLIRVNFRVLFFENTYP